MLRLFLIPALTLALTIHADQAPKKIPEQYPKTDKSSQTLADVISSDPSFSSLLEALKAADLLDTLKGAGPYTLFAPNDKAFAKLSPNTLADLLRAQGREKLYDILTYHIVPGQLNSAKLSSGQAKTLNGKTLGIKKAQGQISVNDVQVVQADIAGLNGTIHVIETVMIPRQKVHE